MLVFLCGMDVAVFNPQRCYLLMNIDAMYPFTNACLESGRRRRYDKMATSRRRAYVPTQSYRTLVCFSLGSSISLEVVLVCGWVGDDLQSSRSIVPRFTRHFT